MITAPPPTPKDALHRAILKMMEDETRRIIEEEAKKAADQVVDRVRGLTGQIATRVASLVRYETMADELRITVSLPDKQ